MGFYHISTRLILFPRDEMAPHVFLLALSGLRIQGEFLDRLKLGVGLKRLRRLLLPLFIVLLGDVEATDTIILFLLGLEDWLTCIREI